MVRKNIFEIIKKNYDIDDEFRTICSLFFGNTLLLNGAQQITIEDAIDANYFYRWKQRGSCVNCNDMKSRLHIDDFILNEEVTCTDDQKLLYLEYFSNLIYLANTYLSFPYFGKMQQMLILEKNIDIMLDYLNYEKHVFNEEEKVIITFKNPVATTVAEISSENTAMAILMYHHASLKGQLEEKRDILRRIAKEYEPLLNKEIEGFHDYFDKANNMLNNLDIRHNNTEGRHKNVLATSLSNEELENWYDELYQLLLFCVLIKDNKERKDKIAEFLKGLNNK